MGEIIKIGINLDLDVEDRYQLLLVHYDIQSIKIKFIELYNRYAPSFFGFEGMSSFIVYLNRCRMMYFDELSFWSKVFELPFHQVVFMQLLYEINSGCTTFISEIEGKKTMIRTFDWPEPFLKEIIYGAKFYKNGREIYEGVCFLGGVGLFTGKNKDYSIAINYRRTGDITSSIILKNLMNILKLYWPVSYLLRDILEKENSYDLAIKRLKESYTVSPVYYSVCNFKGEPMIIQRDSTNFKEISSQREAPSYTIQTNCDNDVVDIKDESKDILSEVDIEYSFARWKLVEKVLSKKNTLKEIIKAIYKFPVIRDDTIFLSIITSDSFLTEIINLK